MSDIKGEIGDQSGMSFEAGRKKPRTGLDDDLENMGGEQLISSES